MVFLYRRAANAKDRYNHCIAFSIDLLYILIRFFGSGVSLRHFYCNFDAFAQMKLWRIQLLSGNKILIKLNIVTQTSGRVSWLFPVASLR